MSSVNITKTVNNDNTSVTIDNLNNELLYTYYTKSYKDIKVVPFSLIDSTYLSNYKEVYDKHKNIVQSIESTISVNGLKGE